MIARWPLVGRDDELADLRRLLGVDRGARGVAIFGDAGVGKTRLVAEAVDTCSDAGATIEWVRATAAASTIPLGAFAHLLATDDEVHQRDDLLHVALSRLDELAGPAKGVGGNGGIQGTGGRGMLLTVDDAHLLDEVSVALLHLALTQSQVRVMLSVRTGEPLPLGLVGLWKDDLVARLDLGPLTRDATEQLVLGVLGQDVPASLLDRVWRLSRGNALFVRELVTVVVENREPGDDGEIALPVEGLQVRLRDLVEERLRLLEPSWRATLERVAVGEQVPLDAAERLSDPADLEALEWRGLVEVTDTGPAGTVQVAHPLYGEILAAGLPRLRRRAVLRELVGAVQDRDDFDRLRLATWQLESGETGDPEQLLLLAREALGRLDHRLAEKLARAAGGAASAEAGLVLSEALAGQGHLHDAEAVLAGLDPVDPSQVARIAMARASHLFLYLDRSSEAFEVLEAAERELADDTAWRAECRSVLAQMLLFSQRISEAGKIAGDLLDAVDTPETATVRAVSVAAVASGAAGRLDAALSLVDDDTVYSLAGRHRRDVPYGDLQLRMARFQTLYWAGQMRQLDDYTAANLGLEMDQPSPSLRGILAGFRGGALLVRGRAHAALAELQRSTRTLAESDWFGQRPLAEAMRARAAVFANDLDTADEAIRAADAAYAADRLRGARTLPFIELSRAWILAAHGEMGEAAARCLALATALEHLAKPFAVEVLHAAVRLGRAADAEEAMGRLGAVVDGRFVQVAVDHTRALARSDADLLASVATAFEEELGADLLAAEAQRSAANAFLRDGRGASAASASRRSDELLERCEMPFSPALEPIIAAGEELTWREREVAMLAARGRTSLEIADTLYLSVRTVDTHLHRVYRKLAIHGRHQLAEALGVAGRSVPGRDT